VDIDQHPLQVAKSILGAKLVYASSLHGIIFAHALNKPCVFVHPQTKEPLLKYEDYFLSVNLPFKKPLDSIDDCNFLKDSDTPPDIAYSEKSFGFPTKDFLVSRNVMTESEPGILK
jgi:hypothetical protein